MDITYSFMIPLMQSIATACHSYGWAIVILTVLVRIVVYPLVASSTRSMQRMSQMQPQIKAIQERYKNEPEMFQKKAMEFYQKNKINPMGGCLPTLVQLPVLWALFATFTGPPFGDRPIPVKVKVVPPAQVAQVTKAEVSGANSPYVYDNGKRAKVIVFPGDETVVAGSSVDFQTRAIDGTLPPDFKPEWKIAGKGNTGFSLPGKNESTDKPAGQADNATIDQNGHAEFREPGEVTVEAVVPGIAKNESFGFIKSLGKVVHGLDLLKPENWDNLVMILLFGVTMWFSQKLMVQPPAPNADPEQLMIQQQTQKTMPIAVTAMFFFIPLPSGVFLYMVVSNVIQSLQTWYIMRKPATALVNVLGDHPSSPGQSGTVIDVTPQPPKIASDESASGNGNGQKKGTAKKKSRKKK